jgi:hypothetical protein
MKAAEPEVDWPLAYDSSASHRCHVFSRLAAQNKRLGLTIARRSADPTFALSENTLFFKPPR